MFGPAGPGHYDEVATKWGFTVLLVELYSAAALGLPNLADLKLET